ncbi:MAG: hypothetical protein OXD50_11520 [Chloroflexi bacterium]|nr:hypothetical protein [Chloroflexota bacterium]
MTNCLNLIKAALPILALAAVLIGCSADPPARLPEHITAVIVYNEHDERWHAGAILSGDRPYSSLRVMCLTEPGRPADDFGHEPTGININASPGERREGESTWSSSISPSDITDPESVWGREWAWQFDGQPWQGGRWRMSTNTRPARLFAENEAVESAFFDDLQDASTAELIGTRDGADELSITFDLTSLFRTPVQFAIDDCDNDAIEQHAGAYHSAYASWLPDWERHSITLMDRDPATDRRVVISCGPKARTDDDAPAWIRQAKGEVYAAATLLGFVDDADHDQADASAVESATVSWVADDGNSGTAVWPVNHSWMHPPSAAENLRFIDALRGSEELTVTVVRPDARPIEVRLRGAALFAKPMGAELDTCIREYTDLNG